MSRPSDPFEREMLAAMPKLRRAAMAWTRNPEQADDLVQDTMVRALGARDSYVLGSNMAAWLCVIGRNLFYSQRRRAWRSVQMPTIRGKDGTERDLTEQIPTPARQQDTLEFNDLLEALSYLPSEQRDAVLLIGEGLSYEEAAAELALEVGTVKSRASRGRAALEAYFTNPSVEEFS